MKPAILLFLLSLASTLPAQVFEIGGFGGVSRLSPHDIGSIAGSTAGSNTAVSLDDGWRMGFRMTLNNWVHMGHEFGYAYNRTKLTIAPDSAGTAYHQSFYNFLVYATPEGAPVRPFVTGGGHFSNFIFPGQSVSQGGGDNKFGYNYGGGIKFKVKPSWGARIDFRQYVTGKPFDIPGNSGKLRQIEVSVGVMFMM